MYGVCVYGVCVYGVCVYGVCVYGVCVYGVCVYGVCVCLHDIVEFLKYEYLKGSITVKRTKNEKLIKTIKILLTDVISLS